MKKLLFGIFLFVTTLFAESMAFAESASCGVDKKCKDGYYCSGAIGESESGVCTANAMNIGLCRFLKYVRKEILAYLFLFGAMFAGIMMWIGKFTMTTLVQILLGIGIIQGAQGLIVLLAGGRPNTTCTASDAKECASSTTGKKSYSATNVVLNLAPVTPAPEYNPDHKKCDDSLTCFRAKCDEYKKVNFPPDKEGESPKVLYTKTDKQITVDWVPGTGPTSFVLHGDKVPAKTAGMPALPSLSLPDDLMVGGDITIKCEPYYGTYTRDYFECTNTCTGVTYGAEASTTWKINTCAELALRNIK